jgi:hypothetical protein
MNGAVTSKRAGKSGPSEIPYLAKFYFTLSTILKSGPGRPLSAVKTGFGTGEKVSKGNKRS